MILFKPANTAWGTGTRLRMHKTAALLFTVIALAAGGTLPGTAGNSDSKHVTHRMGMMTANKANMDILADMMAGRIQFDRSKARTARRQLVQSTGSIRRYFKKPEMDPRSHARPLIWQSWSDFKTRAATASAAAKELDTRSLPALRRTLPGLMQSCISCHETYRSAPNSFTTH